jgi:farnesyl diphosphate synthase
MDKAAKRAKFEEAWARIREELVEHVAGEGMPAEAIEWYGKVRVFFSGYVLLFAHRISHQNLDYNVPGGKLNRGMSVVDSAEIFKGAALNDDEYHRAAVLGWCVELVSGSV